MITCDEHGLQSKSAGQILQEEYPPREAILGGWFHHKHLSMVYSEAGLGKSWFALSLAIAVAGGGEVFGWKAQRPCKVLYVDGEMDIEDIQYRLSKLANSLSVNEGQLKDNLEILAQQDQGTGVEFPDLAKPKGRKVIEGCIKQHDASLVILDSYSTLCEIKDENDSASFAPIEHWLKHLKQDGVSVVLVHHSRKNADTRSAYRGSSRLAVIFNSIIALKRPKMCEPNGGAKFDLIFEKLRGEDIMDTRPFLATLSADVNDNLYWKREKSPDERLHDMVDLALSCEYTSQQELAAALQTDQSTVSRWRRAAIDKGLITIEEWARCLRTAKELRSEDNDDF